MALRDGTSPKVPRKVANCASCLAWGLTYAQGVCMACYNFAAHTKTVGDCGACRRRQLLKKGYCRLCWCQAYLERTEGPGHPLAPWVAKVRHHQLFFAVMNPGVKRRHAPPRAFPRRYGVRGRPLKAAPPVVPRPAPGTVQLSLFDELGSRNYRWGRVDLRNGPPPANPWLDWGLHVAYSMGQARGFGPDTLRGVNRILVVVLADYAGQEPIRLSDFFALVRTHHSGVIAAAEVLGEMGLLHDDRPPRFETWLAGKLEPLASTIAGDVERWALDQRYGGPRRRARPRAAVSYLYAVLPALTEWSTRHERLREITRDEVLAYVGDLYGRQRQMTVVALRSLFTWAKRHGVVFANPATRIPVGRTAGAVWQPLRPEEIARSIEAAVTPRDRLVIALAAIHAARTGAIRALLLDDVDLANRHLTIAGHTRPLDKLTHRLVVDWLDYRRRHWPNTANPHLLVTRASAVRLDPVSIPGITRALCGLPGTVERLRIDRQLEEALASGADPLHLAAVFGIADTTAVRYANSARQLLERPHEQPPAGSGGTEVSKGTDGHDEHLGSP
ncbi:MAG: integrase [Acidimicrobiales bacterium]